MDSILNTIKELLGIPADQLNFDTEVITHINSAFSDLYDIGVGPSEAFSIQDDNAIWDDFLEGRVDFENAKQYVYLSVKVIFDPPASASALAALERRLDKLEWKLQVKGETIENGET